MTLVGSNMDVVCRVSVSIRMFFFVLSSYTKLYTKMTQKTLIKITCAKASLERV